MDSYEASKGMSTPFPYSRSRAVHPRTVSGAPFLRAPFFPRTVSRAPFFRAPLFANCFRAPFLLAPFPALRLYPRTDFAQAVFRAPFLSRAV